MTHVDLMRAIHAIRKWEGNNGEQMFLEIPDRWYEPHKFRCANGHVSTTVLLSEGGQYRDSCLMCHEPAVLTFPEDKDGPIEHPALWERSPK